MHTIFWFENLKGKRPLERHRCRWEDIRIDLGDIGWEGMEWIHFTQDRDQSDTLPHPALSARWPCIQKYQ
jgi:hypothetical protein